MSPSSYHVVRIEDLALSFNRDVMTRLLGFLRVDANAALVTRLVDLSKGHESSYGGLKLSTSRKAEVIAALQGTGNTALRFFGYHTDQWGTDGTVPAFEAMASLDAIPDVQRPSDFVPLTEFPY